MFVGGSRGSELKRNGVKGPPDRRMENGVSLVFPFLFKLFEICPGGSFYLCEKCLFVLPLPLLL